MLVAEDEFVKIAVSAAVSEDVFYAVGNAFVPGKWLEMYCHVDFLQLVVFS